MKTPTIENLVAAYHAGKSIRYRTETGFSELTTRKLGYPQGQPRYGFRHSSHQTEDKSLAFLTDSPEQSIRRALIEPKHDGSFRVIEIWDKVAETAPVPETVPLGENVTRSGLRARVILNNYQQDPNPVVALIQIAKGSRAEKLHYYRSDGSHPNNQDLDLVGFEHPEIKSPESLKSSGGLTPAELNEAGALLCAVKHCWAQMPADLAFNDLLMRRTAPRDWTPENLKLAKRANYYLNEL